MNVNVDLPSFGSPEVVVVDTIDEEKDSEEDPEEEENTKGSESSKSFRDFDRLEYLWDSEDFGPWDD